MSSNFYTNVQLIGNQFLIRGVEDGKRYETRRDFSPTLFIPTKKQSKPAPLCRARPVLPKRFPPSVIAVTRDLRVFVILDTATRKTFWATWAWHCRGVRF